MLQWSLFGIALALILVLAIGLRQFLKLMSKTLEILSQSQNRHMQANQTLTNLILSKDPMTFQQIQATTNSQQAANPAELVNPLDDESVARLLAAEYEARGIDPTRAFAQDDDVDFSAEFGL